MMTFTKLLPPEAAPAQPLLERAKQLVITSEERMTWGDAFETAEGTIAVAVEEKRPLMVNDVFVDDEGQFWVVRPAVEKVLHVKGDLRTMQEAVGALINRGVEVAEAPEGFAVLPLPNIAKMLGMIGLEVTEVEEAFEPVRIQRHAGGCGCGCVCRVLCRFPGASPRLSRPVSCSLRYGGRSPQVSARFAFRGRARTSFPCRIRSRYRADDKPIVEFCITNTYYFDDFINKKNCKSAKML